MKAFSNFNLREYNSYRLSAVCRNAYFPECDEDIRTLFSDPNAKKIVLGGGYNIILSQDYYDADFVVFSGTYNNISLVGEDKVLCQAGVDMKELSEFALANELTGLEIYYDIPSSLGGAVVMNAGAGGEDIKALLIEVYYYDPNTDTFNTISVSDINFEYRNSFFQKNPEMIVCRALLQLKTGNADEIKAKMDKTKEARWAKQPREFPNAGSVFKRPPGRFVGPMIDELGLKGFAVGGAKVSEKHSGFIINYADAKGSDILSLISSVKAKVQDAFGVDLEVEQRVI
ncbi:UDP-N-acetylmuramate dehydrogenase [Mucilaginibacter aquatilis]|uniref:UDP-N-acetylenolpyruvoylglucosamine reductase n=1 Tax=Mucilaginibacter aquatilis TaxID=1517760 RepID=A0A6I4IGP8_9SPHI|nr:UDP-N-acetylmuramate dehydrogenase [Mucilaginibacter aquatilis]MVN92788.1 UDP-N-acetylmuramate dehydrogenase [Mucilaginibacter aquatilis]